MSAATAPCGGAAFTAPLTSPKHNPGSHLNPKMLAQQRVSVRVPPFTDSTRPVIVSALVRKEDEPRSPWWPMLRKRVAQHNVRVVAKWYDALSAARLGQLLGLDAATTEAAVSELVSDKALYCKIDRPAGACGRLRVGVGGVVRAAPGAPPPPPHSRGTCHIPTAPVSDSLQLGPRVTQRPHPHTFPRADAGIYTFQRPRPAAEVLTDYAADVDTVLGLVERVSHLIAKEHMVHGVPGGTTGR